MFTFTPLYQRCVAIVVVGALLTLGFNVKAQQDYQTLVRNYQEQSHLQSEEAAKKIESALTQVYQNLRTISFLPSVQSIARHGENLDTNARVSIQQIYNNLASNVAVSEVYVVPGNLNPDRIDPVTHEKEIPILMFDEVVVSNKKASAEAEEPPEHEEEEIYEYHLFQKQNAWLQAKHPHPSGTLEIPMVAGPSVVTCDNTDYDGTLKDDDRKGVLFSVPFYDAAGHYKGVVSAIVRDNVFKTFLPKSDYALINTGYKTAIPSTQAGEAGKNAPLLLKGESQPSLLYSEVLPLKTADAQHEWKLWAGLPNAQFEALDGTKSWWQFLWLGNAFLVGGTAASVFLFQAWVRRKEADAEEARQHAEQEAKEQALKQQMEQERLQAQREREEQERRRQIELKEQQLIDDKRRQQELQEQREADLQRVAQQFESSVKRVVSDVIAASQSMLSASTDLCSITEESQHKANETTQAATDSSNRLNSISASTQQLSIAINSIREQTQLSNTISQQASKQAALAKDNMVLLQEKALTVSKVLSLITNIMDQINLLALNASIEAVNAGDAGRSFAVVANEVKELAGRVSHVAEDIAVQVKEMQHVTQRSNEAVGDISDVMQNMTSSIQTLAAAVEEQSAATADITSTLVATSNNATQVFENVGIVCHNTDKTSGIAQHVLDVSKELNSKSNQLQEQVASFVKSLG